MDLQGGDYDVRKEFEERQRRAEKSETYEPARESWMTELPRDRTGVRVSGTEARTFLKRGGEVEKLRQISASKYLVYNKMLVGGFIIIFHL